MKINENLKIKEVKIQKFNKKTGNYDKVKSIFEGYKIQVNNNYEHPQVIITGPKAEFLLIENMHGLRLGGMNTGEKVRFFRIFLQKKIQGCVGFHLDEKTNTLVPYVAGGSWGASAVKELKGFQE